MIICPLCYNSQSLTIVKGPDSRSYRECKKCSLIFTESSYRPSATDEKKRYLSHKNGIQYEGYVKFLNQAIDPVLPLLKKNMKGLDFGCGPTPTLSLLIENQGYICDNYDPLFFPDMPDRFYDFIFATECFEHFFFPEKEIIKIKEILNPGGLIIVMTELWDSIDSFSNWVYAKDWTHVSFYHVRTFAYIAENFGLNILKSNNERVIILQKPVEA